MPAMPAAPACSSLRIRVSVTPPSAITGTPAWRTMAAKRFRPSARAWRWLSVAKTGDRSTASAPSRPAFMTAPAPCAEAVTRPGPSRARSQAFQFESAVSGMCTPSQISRAGGVACDISTRTPWRRAAGRISVAMRVAPPASRWRTMTALPGGKKGISGDGSGRRRSSVMTTQAGTAWCRSLFWRRVVVNVRCIALPMAAL